MDNRCAHVSHPVRLSAATRSRELPALASSIVLCCLFLILCARPPGAFAGEEFPRGPGPQIIHAGGGSPDVVCIAISVPVGSACEPAGMRGACHFIEHLVFDGSERYSREEMSSWVDDAGAFLNAFTRKETTVYFLVVRSPLLEEGLDILSQMLLHSVFLAPEIEKERSVILEEMRREADDPRTSRERLVERALYRGSVLAEPVVGYPSTIAAMDELDLKRFYRQHYDPSRMRIILMGGYDPARAERLVGDYFGVMPADERVLPAGRHAEPAADAAPCGVPTIPRWRNEIVTKSGGASDTEFDCIVRLPAVSDHDFPAALLAARLVESEDSPLVKGLAALSLPAPEVSVEIAAGYSALRVNLTCPDSLASACRAVPDIIRSLAEWKPSRESVRNARTASLAALALDREMYHFFIMLHGEAIALHGSRYLDAVTEGVAAVDAASCSRVLEKWFRDPSWNACLITGSPRSGVEPPPAGSVPFVEDLPGGGSIGVETRVGSSAAAVHLLLRGRSCAAPYEMPGLVELLLTFLESSPEGAKLARELHALGARVAYGDNPYIPMDDYLLNPAFACIRLEAPASSIVEAAALLGRHLGGDAAMESSAINEARESLMRETGMRMGSPYYALRSAMMKSLFGAHPYAAALFPPPAVTANATAADLDALRKRLFARGNGIATIVSPLDREAARAIAVDLLDRMPPGPPVVCPAFPDSAAPKVVERTIHKEGAYLSTGWIVPCASPGEIAAVFVAGEILARRMQLELREKRGLAYSIDCTVMPCPGGAAVMAYLGTGAGRLDEALGALQDEIIGLEARSPGSDEVATAKRRLAGARARSELSSANAAYSLGFDMLLGSAVPFESLDESLERTDADAVREIISRFLAWERANLVRLVPEP